jgi:hypothetical protein
MSTRATRALGLALLLTLSQRSPAQAAEHDSLPELEAAVFTRLQRAVAANDRTAAAEAFVYPFRVNRTRTSYVLIRSRAELLRRYDTVLPLPVRRAILVQHPDSLFYSWRGSMVGRGEVWIDGVCDETDRNCRYGVVAINLPDKRRSR